jgi:hypothetical protein
MLIVAVGLVLVSWEAYRARSAQFSTDTSTTTKTTTVRKTTTTGTETIEKREVTTAPNQGFPERMLGQGGLWLARILLVLLAAFLAGATVQRAILGNFAFKAGGLEVPPLPAPETEELEELPPSFAAAFQTDVSPDALPAQLGPGIVSSSYVMDLLNRIQGEGVVDYAIIDLGSGTSWLTTRLFIFAILLRRMRSLRAFVLVETREGIEKRFLGVKSPEAVRFSLAREYPWLERAFANAYAATPNLTIRSESGALEPHAAGTVVERFIHDESIQSKARPQDDEWIQLSSGTSEHARWINRSLIERLFGVSPLQSSVEDVDDLTSTQRTAAILACHGPFVALVDKDRRFKALVDRNALLERAVRLIAGFNPTAPPDRSA